MVVPARHTCSKSIKIKQEKGSDTDLDPIMAGIDSPVQLCNTAATANDILNMAVMAACKVG